MALLLHALREVRNLSGDLDLLPPLVESGSPWVSRPPRNLCELTSAPDRHGSFPFTLSPVVDRRPEPSVATGRSAVPELHLRDALFPKGACSIGRLSLGK